MRDLEEALIRTLGAFGLEGVRYDGLTGVWMPPSNGQGPRKIASIGVHVSRWVTTHGYALNVDLDPAPFTEWITACGLEDAQFTTDGDGARAARGRGAMSRPAAVAALGDVFGLALEELPADDGAGLWPQSDPRLARGAMSVDIRPFPRLGLGPLPGDGVVGVVGRAARARGRLLRRPVASPERDHSRAPGRAGHDRRLHRR